MFAQVLEAVRALEEGVLLDVREGDVVRSFLLRLGGCGRLGQAHR